MSYWAVDVGIVLYSAVSGTKPLFAPFTAMVLVELRDTVIHPVACDIGNLAHVLLRWCMSRVAGRLENKYIDITSRLPNLFLNHRRSSLSCMRLLGFHLLPASCVTSGRSSSITNKGSPHSLSSYPFRAHRLTSQTLEQLVPLSAHSPTRLNYPNQDIPSCCTSTSRT